MKNEKRGIDGDMASRILYCDSGCVIVNKVAGEAVEGAGKGMIDLPRLLADELAASNWPAVLPSKDALALPTAVQRLDVPVSGCAVFARTAGALRFLNDVFRNNAAEKRYWAIVEPSNNVPENAELVHWIQFDPKRNKSIAHNEPGPGRKKAILRCRLAGRGRDYLFLEIELITGRHHQIRAQLERLGIHIKGDLKYGSRRSEPNGGIRLHARLLSFPAPEHSADRRITVQADPPMLDNLWQACAEAFSPGQP
jgi:23S rRNA pseudouridine1911/1915/1917 synthase